MNEEYPASCIIYRELLKPDQSKFKVPGYDKDTIPHPAAAAEKQDGEEALTAKPSTPPIRKTLKPPRRDQLAREPQTPSPGHRLSPNTASLQTTEDQTVLFRAGSLYNDALQDAIGRIKETADLVSVLTLRTL